MTRFARTITGFALFCNALVLTGCGGNTGTQVTTLDRSLTIASGSTFLPGLPVDSVGGASVSPIAQFDSTSGQSLVVWGSRTAETGAIGQITQAAYWTDLAKPLYAKYNADGGLTSVKDVDSGSYVTFSPLEGASVTATGFDATSGKTGSIRATLSDIGITVVVLDDGSRTVKRSQLVTFAELGARPKPRLIGRSVDPLLGFSTIYRDSADRTRIITAIFRAAALVVDKPFDKILSDVAGFLLLDQLVQSYGSFAAKGQSTNELGMSTTPIPYLNDLP